MPRKRKPLMVALYVRIPVNLDRALDVAIGTLPYGSTKAEVVASAIAAHVEKLGVKVERAEVAR